tara:strand:+ start:2383 stop:3654 length:1272 start_codon:yes stop_codon:yes gene_type:complete
MSFNFGAFLGGMSKQISTNIEDAKRFNREKEFRMDMLAEEEATKMRLAKSSERRAQRKQDQQNAALLKSMGYTDAQSGWIMQGGGATVTLYSDFAKKAYARGINPADILETNLINPDQQDPRNEAALISVIDSTKSDRPFTSKKSKIYGASKADAANPFTIRQDIMTSVLGEVEEVKAPKQYTSLEAGHAGTYSLLQEAIKKGDKDEITRLEDVLGEWKAKIKEDIELRKPDDDTGKDPSYFTKPSRETIRKNALSDAYTEFDFETDLNGNITANLEGRQGAKIVARIAAADTIERQANVAEGVIDTNLMGEATSIRASAEQALTSYGQAIVEQKGGSDSKTKKFGYLKSTKEVPLSNYKMNEGGNSGKYKVGDVVIAEVAQPEGGTILKVFVYTGRRDPNDMGIEVQGRKLYNFFHDAGRLY